MFWNFVVFYFKYVEQCLAPKHLSEIELHNNRCHFRAFQLELHIPDTKNIEIRSVVAKLQLSENRKKLQNRVLDTSDSPSTLGPTVVQGAQCRDMEQCSEQPLRYHMHPIGNHDFRQNVQILHFWSRARCS